MPEFLEYFDQPPSIQLEYESPNGRRMVVRHTPNFFVIRETEAGWEEWKTGEELQRLSERNPNRSCTDDGGRWSCPPGRAYAEPLGLYYRVRSSADIDRIFQRNIQFLEDYFRAGSTEILPANRENAVALVSATPGMSLADLLQLSQGAITPDDIFTMIASGDLYVDLRAAALAEPSKVKVFATPEATLRSLANGTSNTLHPSVDSVRCGSRISWDGCNWEVVNVGETAVSLLSDEKLAEVPIAAFETLIRENRAQMLPADRDTDRAIRERLSRASEADLQAATHRSGLISQYRMTGVLPGNPVVPARTFFRWLAQYRKAEAAYGSGFVGLLPQSSGRGNHKAKLPETSRRLMQECIESDYETLKQKTKYASWIRLKRMCEAQTAPVPSYKTFCLAVQKRSAFDQTLKRKRRRASYQVAAFYWDLDLQTPRHGDRPFEIAHIDHTELDVECVASAGHRLGRPWLTLLTDAFSRRTLAFYLTFDPPSYRSCMMTLRESIRRCIRRQVSRRTVSLSSHLIGSSVPTIDIMLRICHRLDIPIAAFLEKDPRRADPYWRQARQAVQHDRNVPARRSAEQVRVVLSGAAQEEPVPSLSEIARRLGYKGTERLYQVDSDLSKQIAAKYRQSGRSHLWKKPNAERICERVDLRRLLEQSLAQDRPVSPHRIAASLGYANDGYLRRKLPDLCRAIAKKIAEQQAERLANMERFLAEALKEDPVPTLQDLARRLGYSSSTCLQLHFPGLCQQILARQQAARQEKIADVKRTLQDLLLEVPAVSFRVASQRTGFSCAYLKELCPEECAALGSWYVRWRHEASERRKMRLVQEVRDAVRQLYDEGKCPTVERVMSLLPKTALREWKTLTAAVKAARQAIENE